VIAVSIGEGLVRGTSFPLDGCVNALRAEGVLFEFVGEASASGANGLLRASGELTSMVGLICDGVAGVAGEVGTGTGTGTGVCVDVGVSPVKLVMVLNAAPDRVFFMMDERFFVRPLVEVVPVVDNWSEGTPAWTSMAEATCGAGAPPASSSPPNCATRVRNESNWDCISMICAALRLVANVVGLADAICAALCSATSFGGRTCVARFIPFWMAA